MLPLGRIFRKRWFYFPVYDADDAQLHINIEPGEEIFELKASKSDCCRQITQAFYPPA